jgi:anthranilate phosphoribosyltransferase
VGIGFLLAPRFHPAWKNVGVTRREMGIRTVFNMLGPLANPAFASIQLIGVFDERLTELMTSVLNLMGSESVMVVHGNSGLDELSTTGVNKVTQLRRGRITTFHLDARDFGLPRAGLEDLKGGNPRENVKIALELLEGKKDAKRDIVLLNTSALLVTEGTASDFREGINIAAEVIDKGKAREKLEALVRLTQELEQVEKNPKS